MKTSREIAQYLMKKDKTMKLVISDSFVVERAIEKDYFLALVDNIVSQQISARVADVLCQRLKDLCGGKISVSRLKACSDESIRELGISYSKITYLRSLIAAIDNKIIDLKTIDKYSDQEIIDKLTIIKGIGPWSAEMFLIFSLEKEDVFSIHDGALQRAVSHYYLAGEKPSKKQLIQVSEKWRPYRSYASFYLWDSLKRI